MTSRDTFTLAHLSDPHLSSPEGARLGELLNKRALGYLSWRLRRRHEHRDEVLSALLRDLTLSRPDHTAITGDLTHLGLPAEFRMVASWLTTLGPPSKVTVIPGNHDAYARADWRHTFAHWADYMSSDRQRRRPVTGNEAETSFPLLRRRRRTALIGISTARPTAPFLAVGHVGKIQLRKLEEILAETGRQGLLRIVLIHHPPLPGLIAWRKRLVDAEQLRSVLQRRGAELVLHGHAHRTSFSQQDTPGGTVTTIGVSSASALGGKPGRRARYHLFRLTRAGGGWDVLFSVRRYSFDADRFVEESRRRLTIPGPPG